jgi:hypothetical protein
VGGLLEVRARRLVTDPAGRFAALAERPDLLGIDPARPASTDVDVA